MSFPLRPQVNLGVVPTHLKFVGGLVPDENGKIPRGEDGRLLVVSNLSRLKTDSSVPIDCVQVPYFPGLDEGDVEEMVSSFRELGLQVYFILMIGGGDPMNPEDEDAVAEILVGGLNAAKKHQIEHVSSTSVEQWMAGGSRKDGSEFDAAVAQNVNVHVRAFEEADLANSCVKAWHIEFLRNGEFQTFTDIGRAWKFVEAINQRLGNPFFKVMVDAAHCGDSDLTIPENEAFIQKIAQAGALGVFHASAKTTRGCLSTDDGWIGALLTACAATGALETLFVEVFHHEDDALEGLRQLVDGHGVDTTDGRTYDEVVIDGLTSVGRRLNNLAARGILS